MLLLDNREGSCELEKPLKALGLPVTSTRLEYGDIAFTGKGIAHHPLDIGIEYKKLPELVQSIRDGRFSGHQLTGMVRTKDAGGQDIPGMYDYAWLLVEGAYQTDSDGALTVPLRTKKYGFVPIKPFMHTSEYQKHLLTFQLCGGVYHEHVHSRTEAVRFIGALYRWWTDKAIDEHTSHLAPHRQTGFLPLSDFRATISTRFPGIGAKASKAVEAHFKGSLQKACTASAEEWARIEVVDKAGKPRRIGMKVAEQIRAFVLGGA